MRHISQPGAQLILPEARKYVCWTCEVFSVILQICHLGSRHVAQCTLMALSSHGLLHRAQHRGIWKLSATQSPQPQGTVQGRGAMKDWTQEEFSMQITPPRLSGIVVPCLSAVGWTLGLGPGPALGLCRCARWGDHHCAELHGGQQCPAQPTVSIWELLWGEHLSNPTRRECPHETIREQCALQSWCSNLFLEKNSCGLAAILLSQSPGWTTQFRSQLLYLEPCHLVNGMAHLL